MLQQLENQKNFLNYISCKTNSAIPIFMKKTIYFSAIAILLFNASCKKQLAEKNTDIEWSKTFGGSGNDLGFGAVESGDGGYIVVGSTTSNDGDVAGRNHCFVFADLAGVIHKVCGQPDGWMLKLDRNGDTVWQSLYGGTDLAPFYDVNINVQGPNKPHQLINPDPNTDVFTSIAPAANGVFMITGQTNQGTSDTATFTTYGINGRLLYNPTRIWITQIGNNGVIRSPQYLMGSRLYDSANCIKYLNDEGFIVGGTTNDGGKIVANLQYGNYHGSNSIDGINDAFLFKLNKSGSSAAWIRWMGGNGYDKFNSVTQIADNTIVAVGQSNSFDGDLARDGNRPHGQNDVWVANISLDGQSIISTKTYGGENDDIANAVAADTKEGGFIVAGQTNSNDGDVTGNHSSNYDAWIIKFDPAGKMLWRKTYGSTFGNDIAKSITQTTDGGFVFAGQTSGNDGDVSGNHGYSDAWVVKIDKNGKMMWQQTLGGSSADGATSVLAASDGSLLLTGYSFSNDGDISRSRANADLWVVKLRRH